MEKETASWANGGSHAGSRQLFVDRVKGHTQLMKLAIEEMENFAKEKVNEIQSGSSSQSLAGMLNTEIATLLRGGGDIGPRGPEELQWRAGFYVFGARYSGGRADGI